MTSLYARYIAEKFDRQIIEKEWGFLSYSISYSELIKNDGGQDSFILFIHDLFIQKESRGYPLLKMNKELDKVAKANKCDFVTCSIKRNDEDLLKLIKLYEKLGFDLCHDIYSESSIYLKRKVENG